MKSPRIRALYQFLRFNIVGLVNSAVTYGVYSLLVYLGVQYPIALVVVYVIGIIFSSIANMKFTFGLDLRITSGLLIRITSVYILALGLNLILSRVMIDNWNWNPYISQLVAMGTVSISTFLLQKKFVFQIKEIEEHDSSNS